MEKSYQLVEEGTLTFVVPDGANVRDVVVTEKPYATSDPVEQQVLDDHPLVQEAGKAKKPVEP